MKRAGVTWWRSRICKLSLLSALLLSFDPKSLTADNQLEPSITGHLPPHISSVSLEEKWSTRGWPIAIEWSQDGARLRSISGGIFERWLRVQDEKGNLLHEFPVLDPWALHVIIDDHRVAMPGDSRIGVSISIADLSTGKIVFSERDPAPNERGTASGSVRFAMSRGKPFLLVGYGFPRGNQPIHVYNTLTLRETATFSVPDPAPMGVGQMRVSALGDIFAFRAASGVAIANSTSGAIVRTLPISASDFAFSSDGTMLATVVSEAATVGSSKTVRHIEVFRISDGVQLASWRPSSGAVTYVSQICWDPSGRFLVFIDDKSELHIWSPLGSHSDGLNLRLRQFSGALNLSPDGTRLAVGDGDAIDLFRIRRSAGNAGGTHVP
jgi:hypothetical protein